MKGTRETALSIKLKNVKMFNKIQLLYKEIKEVIFNL